MSKFGDAIKNAAHAATSLVVEDDGQETKPAPAPAAHPVNTTGFHFDTAPGFGAPASASSPFSVPSAVVDENVYQGLLKKTNFDETPVGKAIHKYYDALDGVIADQTQRFKAAIGQAQKLDGVTPDAVLAAFDGLTTTLGTAATQFQQIADNVESREITARQTKIQDLQTQVTNINAQIAQLSGELTEQQTKHANAVTQFGLASQRRATEIAQQKAQFTALLSH